MRPSTVQNKRSVGKRLAEIGDPLVERSTLADFIVELGLRRLPHCEMASVFEHLHLPPFRNRPERRSDERKFFVAGEAEVDEPLAVEGAGHLLQNPDAPLIVLDQIVVGRQDARDPPLHRKRGNARLQTPADRGEANSSEPCRPRTQSTGECPTEVRSKESVGSTRLAIGFRIATLFWNVVCGVRSLSGANAIRPIVPLFVIRTSDGANLVRRWVSRKSASVICRAPS